jgi:ketosteroid isomerase-like protein
MLRADLVDAHRALLRAYEAEDVTAFIALLDPTPQLLIFHPLRQDRWDGIEEVRENLGAMFKKLGPAFWSEVHTQASLQGEVGWVSYHVVIERQAGGEAFVGRGTEVWVHRADGWKLSQGHWSEQPGGA